MRGPGEHHGELVAAEPSGRRVLHGDAQPAGLSQAARETLRGAADELVPGRVSEAVVDALEVVQVDDEYAEARSAAPGVVHGEEHPLLEELAIAEAGQLVVEGQVLDLLLAAPPLGHVLGDALATDFPRNSRFPVRVSKNTQPKAHTSVLLSSGFPLACSGLM